MANPQQAETQEAKAMDGPKTVAEATGFKKTSTHVDVLAFLDKLRGLPQAARLHRMTLGKSVEGRELPLLVVAEPPLTSPQAVRESGKLRIFVNANIHAGEVEGKEAVQMLLREIAHGGHADFLRHAVLFFVPVFNADGNERFDKRNRASQNGPDGGVGIRPNADGYDLNRDFIKLDTPEARALVRAFGVWDPHVFMDLHTTNGSHHGYHLTYAPSLATNVDPALRDFNRKLFLPDIRRETSKRHAFRTYDYGNFAGRVERRWSTYDHRPRFGTNCFGLRNRIAVLSEAYSCISFEERIKVTRAFVIETIRSAVAHRAKIVELTAAADKRAEQGGLTFGYASRLEDAWQDDVLVGSVKRVRIEGAGIRVVANPDFETKRMPVQVAFVSDKSLDLPQAWAIQAPSERAIEALTIHGIAFERLSEPREVGAEVFEITKASTARREFQKHNERRFEGKWVAKRLRLGKGTLLVSARHRLARLAAQLLEPQSEDSLATWNYFDEDLFPDEKNRVPDFPVIRVTGA
jgi:hypothetical protein